MRWSIVKYTAIFTGPLVGWISFTQSGWWTFSLPIYTYVIIPFIELFTTGTTKNLTQNQEEQIKKDRLYDLILYLMVPLQYSMLGLFIWSIMQPEITLLELAGRILTFGVSCAVLAVNVGHELGHRVTWYEQIMAKMLYLSTQYMHFIIEHNRGHHKRVATKNDPATARYGESLYAFWIRSVWFGYTSAWKLEAKRLKKQNKPFISIYNEMIWYQFLQAGLLFLIFLLFGLKVMLSYWLAAVLGFLMLETVNYIEHYGLTRKQTKNGNYEKVLPIHSWNSNHSMGRALLFELTRHSDHHYKASRKYQILRHFDDSPQMPTGYPGMLWLSLFPPLWFYVMHKHISKLKSEMPSMAALG